MSSQSVELHIKSMQKRAEAFGLQQQAEALRMVAESLEAEAEFLSAQACWLDRLEFAHSLGRKAVEG